MQMVTNLYHVQMINLLQFGNLIKEILNIAALLSNKMFIVVLYIAQIGIKIYWMVILI